MVIPTRNRPREVRKAMSNALNQTFHDLEVIVVVDGPDPATEEVLLTVLDSRLRSIINTENQGLAESRNIGIRAAHGEWIALLDDDDEWFPEKIERQFRKAEETGGTHLLIVSRFLEKTAAMKRVWPETLPNGTRQFSEYLFCRRGMLVPSSYFASRTLLLDIPFTKGLRHVEDLDWLLRATNDPRTNVAGVPEALVVYNNFAIPGRESLYSTWKILYDWGIANRSLFTPRAFSFYMTKVVAPRAKEARASWRELFHVFSAAVLFGSFNVKSITFFFVSILFSRDSKRKIREILSPRARKSRALANSV